MNTTTAPTTITEAEVDDLAHAVATDGPAAHERRLRSFAAAVVAVVRPSPRTDVAVEVMLDRTAAPVLRSRAFSLVSAALTAEPRSATVLVRDRAA
ncbi:MAG TPA: hypothetical protein VK507_01350 [Iamia sp.]|nr:hypothetical protein [Iamia sp.]